MEKKSFWKKAGAFLAGKGFYAVLALCAILIGVSAWALSRTLGSVETIPEDTAAAAEASARPSGAPARAPSGGGAVLPDLEGAFRPLDGRLTGVDGAEEADAGSDEDEAVSAGAAAESWVWPVSGGVVLEYASDELIWNMTMADWRTHPALDLAAPIGARVSAVTGGTVSRVDTDDLLGTYVVVRHDGDLESVYANLAATPAVSEGDFVSAGDVIGAVGDTALGETGDETHLHFAMLLDGEPVDPGEYLPER